MANLGTLSVSFIADIKGILDGIKTVEGKLREFQKNFSGILSQTVQVGSTSGNVAAINQLTNSINQVKTAADGLTQVLRNVAATSQEAFKQADKATQQFAESAKKRSQEVETARIKSEDRITAKVAAESRKRASAVDAEAATLQKRIQELLKAPATISTTARNAAAGATLGGIPVEKLIRQGAPIDLFRRLAGVGTGRNVGQFTPQLQSILGLGSLTPANALQALGIQGGALKSAINQIGAGSAPDLTRQIALAIQRFIIRTVEQAAQAATSGLDQVGLPKVRVRGGAAAAATTDAAAGGGAQAVAATAKELDGLTVKQEKATKLQRGINAELERTTNEGKKTAEEFNKGLLRIPVTGSLFNRLFGNFAESMEIAISLLFRFQAARTIIVSVQKVFTELRTAALNFEDSMAQVAAITGESETSLIKLSDAAREVGRTTIVSATEAADGLKILAQAGFETTDAVSALGSLVALAVGGVSTMDQAAQLLTSTLRAFNIDAGESSRVVNVLVATVNKSKSSIEDLNTAFNFAGTTAANAGLTIEDLGGLIGVLADNGVRASTQGTALRQVLGALIEPTAKAQKVFDRLGINLADINPLTNDIVDIFETLAESGFSTADSFEAFDKRAGSAIATLVRQSGAIREMRDRITGTNAAFEALATRQSSLSAQIDIANNRFKDFAITFGNTLLPAIKSVFGVFNSFLKVLAGAKVPAEVLAVAITALAGSLFSLKILDIAAHWRIYTARLLAHRLASLKVTRAQLEQNAVLNEGKLIQNRLNTRVLTNIKGSLQFASATSILSKSFRLLWLNIQAVATQLVIFATISTVIALFVKWRKSIEDARIALLEEQEAAIKTANTIANAVEQYDAAKEAVDRAKFGTGEYSIALLELDEAYGKVVTSSANASAALSGVGEEIRNNTQELKEFLINAEFAPRIARLQAKIAEIDAKLQDAQGKHPSVASRLLAERSRYEDRIKFFTDIRDGAVAASQSLNEAGRQVSEITRQFGGSVGREAAIDRAIDLARTQLEGLKGLGFETEKVIADVISVIRESPEGAAQSDTFTELVLKKLGIKKDEQRKASPILVGALRRVADDVGFLVNQVNNQTNKAKNAFGAFSEIVNAEDAKRKERQREQRKEDIDADRSLKAEDKARKKALIDAEELQERAVNAVRIGLQSVGILDAEATKGIDNIDEFLAAIFQKVDVDALGDRTEVLNELVYGLETVNKNIDEAATSAASKQRLQDAEAGYTALAAKVQAVAEAKAAELEREGDLVAAVNLRFDAERRALLISSLPSSARSIQLQTMEIQRQEALYKAIQDKLDRNLELTTQDIELQAELSSIIEKRIQDEAQFEQDLAEAGKRPGVGLDRARFEAETKINESQIRENLSQQAAIQQKIIDLTNRKATQAGDAAETTKREIVSLQQELQSLEGQNVELERKKALIKGIGETTINVGDTLKTTLDQVIEGVAHGESLENVPKNLGNALFTEITGALTSSLVKKLEFDQAFTLNMKGLGDSTRTELGGAFGDVFGLAGNLLSGFASNLLGVFGNIGSGLLPSLFGGVSGTGGNTGVGFLGSIFGGGTAPAGGGTTSVGSFANNLLFGGSGGTGGLAGGVLGPALGIGVGALIGKYTRNPFFGALSSSALFGGLPIFGKGLLPSLISKIPGIPATGGLLSFARPVTGLLGNFVKSIIGGANLLGGASVVPDLLPQFATQAPLFKGPLELLNGLGPGEGVLLPETGAAAAGQTGAQGLASVLSALQAVLAIASLITTGIQASKLFGAAQDVTLGQSASTDKLRGLQLGSLAIGTGVGAAVGAVGGPIGALVGAALGAAISQAINQAITGAIGKGVSQAAKKGLNQEQLEKSVYDDTTIRVLTGDNVITGRRGTPEWVNMTFDIINPIGSVINELVAGSIPDIEKFFRKTVTDRITQSVGRTINPDVFASGSTVFGEGLNSAQLKRLPLFGGSSIGSLGGDTRALAQILAILSGAGNENKQRLRDYTNILVNGFAKSRKDGEELEQVILRITKINLRNIVSGLAVIGRALRPSSIGAQRAANLTARSFGEFIPTVEDPGQFGELLVREGFTGGNRRVRRQSRKITNEALGSLFGSESFDEGIQKFRSSIADSMTGAIQEAFTKVLSRGPLATLLRPFFTAIRSGLRNAINRGGLTDIDLALFTSKVDRSVSSINKFLSSFGGELQRFFQIIEDVQDQIDEALLSLEEKQKNRYDLFTQIRDAIYDTVQKLGQIIKTQAEDNARFIQKQANLAALGTDDEGKVPIAAAEALRVGVQGEFGNLITNVLGKGFSPDQVAQALTDFEGSVDNFVQTAVQAVKDQFEESIQIAKQSKELFKSVQNTIRAIVIGDQGRPTEDKLAAIQNEIKSEREILASGDPKEQLEAAQNLQGLYQELLNVAGEELDQSGPQFASVRNSVENGLQLVASFLKLNADDLESLEEERNTLLRDIGTEAAGYYTFIKLALGDVRDKQRDEADERLRKIIKAITGDSGTSVKEAIDDLRNKDVNSLKEIVEAINNIVIYQPGFGPGENLPPDFRDPELLPEFPGRSVARRSLRKDIQNAQDVGRRKAQTAKFEYEAFLTAIKDAGTSILGDIRNPDHKAWWQTLIDVITSPENSLFRVFGSELSFEDAVDALLSIKREMFNILPDFADDFWVKFRNAATEKLADIATFAQGGVAFGPTFGLFGEAGPEALVPLTESGMTRFIGLMTRALEGSGSALQSMLASANIGREVNVNVTIAPNAFVANINGGDPKAMKRLPEDMVNAFIRDLKYGKIRQAIKEAVK